MNWKNCPGKPWPGNEMIRLNDVQLKQLADFASNMGIVFLATVITPLFSGIEGANIVSVLTGLGFMTISILISLSLLRRIKK